MIGALYVATGRELPEILKFGGDFNACTISAENKDSTASKGFHDLFAVSTEIQREYGLTFKQQKMLQRTGDGIMGAGLEIMRQVLLRTLDNIDMAGV